MPGRCEQLQKLESVGDVAKQTSSAALVEQTAKGKKIATWALTSRHHNSHPQLPSTRPKKALPDRGELSCLIHSQCLSVISSVFVTSCYCAHFENK